MNSLRIDPLMKIETHDMHTGGEPLRIIRTGVPTPKGGSVLERRQYARQHLDNYRKLLMNEPRGHRDMYGAILNQHQPLGREFDALFLNNEGYSPMCGHAIIALGRYVVDSGLVEPSSPETELVFNCPCGPVKAFVEYSNSVSGRVRFQSVPAFAYRIGAKVEVENVGLVELDIAFGGAFYAIVEDKKVSLDVNKSPLRKIIDLAGLITDAVKKQVTIRHPEHDELSFLYGTIITDGKDNYLDGPSTNICVFADKQVDRSPTGSGVTARVALNVTKGLMTIGQEKEFKSIIGTSFTGKAVRTAEVSSQVIVEVCGKAHHVGDHVFYLEDDDPCPSGFMLPS